MLGITRTSGTSQTGQRCLCTQHPAFFSRNRCPRRVQTVFIPALVIPALSDTMTSHCLGRKECTVVNAQWDRSIGENTGRIFLSFGGPVCANQISNCPLDRVLTYQILIYLLILQINKFQALLLGPDCSDCHGQYHRCLLHKQGGKSEIRLCTFLW